MKSFKYLKGSLIIANPYVTGDSANSVILITSHDLGIIQGICINKPHEMADQYTMFDRIIGSSDLPFTNSPSFIDKPIFVGGKKTPTTGVILNDDHLDKYVSTTPIAMKVNLTMSNDILLNISTHKDPPDFYKICLGRFIWKEKDLLALIKYGRYFVLRATHNLVFQVDYKELYNKCFEILGIDPYALDKSSMINFDDLFSLDDNLSHLYWSEHTQIGMPAHEDFDDE